MARPWALRLDMMPAPGSINISQVCSGLEHDAFAGSLLKP
jgi:hypothetical protein